MYLKKLKHTRGVDASNSASNSTSALKAEVDQLDISKLVNVPTSLNNFRAKVDDLDVAKLKSVSIDLRKLYGVVSKEVVKT